jgi:hypothetical protein
MATNLTSEFLPEAQSTVALGLTPGLQSAADMENTSPLQIMLSDHPSSLNAVPQISPSLESLAAQMTLTAHLAESRNLDGLIKRVSTILWRAGFSDWSHTLINTSDDARDPVGTAKPDLKKIYYGEQFWKHDLLLNHTILSDKPILQSQVMAHIKKSTYENDAFRRTTELNKIMTERFNIYEHYSIPFQSVGGKGRAMFSVGIDGPDIKGARKLVLKTRAALNILATAVDYVGSSKFDKDFHARFTMRPRPMGVAPLRLLKTIVDNDGCKLETAAEILEISVKTANNQIAAIKSALGANTIQGAVIKAVRLGLIQI